MKKITLWSNKQVTQMYLEAPSAKVVVFGCFSYHTQKYKIYVTPTADFPKLVAWSVHPVGYKNEESQLFLYTSTSFVTSHFYKWLRLPCRSKWKLNWNGEASFLHGMTSFHSNIQFDTSSNLLSDTFNKTEESLLTFAIKYVCMWRKKNSLGLSWDLEGIPRSRFYHFSN